MGHVGGRGCVHGWLFSLGLARVLSGRCVFTSRRELNLNSLYKQRLNRFVACRDKTSLYIVETRGKNKKSFSGHGTFNERVKDQFSQRHFKFQI